MTALFIAGLAAIIAGAAIIYPPAGLIVFGAAAVSVALRLGDTE